MKPEKEMRDCFCCFWQHIDLMNSYVQSTSPKIIPKQESHVDSSLRSSGKKSLFFPNHKNPDKLDTSIVMIL